MSAGSDYTENKLLDHLLGTAAFTMPSATYLALYTSDPEDDNSGAEVTGGGYARELITFDPAVDGVAANNIPLNFAATGDWGEVTHFGIFDALEDGNLLIRAPFEFSRTILTDDELTLRVGDIEIEQD